MFTNNDIDHVVQVLCSFDWHV